MSQEQLDGLRDGIAIDGILYGAVEATVDSRKGDNVWLTVGLREGKNREVKNILAHLGLDVNRLIRLSFGPFLLGSLAEGAVEEVPRRVLKEQLGERLAIEAGADFRVREGDREPVQTRPEALTAEPRRRSREIEAAPEEKGRVARAPRRPDATASRRRHEADVEHNAEARTAPNRSRGRLGAKPGTGPAAAERTGAPARRVRAERAEPVEAPRAHRSGKSFDVARKGKAVADEAPRPGRTGGKPKPVALDDPNARIARPPKAAAQRGGRKPAPVETRRRERPGDDGGFRPQLDARPPRPDEVPRRERAGRDAMPTGTVWRPKAERGNSEGSPRRERPDRASAPAKGGLRSKGMLGPKPEGGPSKARGTRSHGGAATAGDGPRRPRPADLDAPRGSGRAKPDRGERTGGSRPERAERTAGRGGDAGGIGRAPKAERGERSFGGRPERTERPAGRGSDAGGGRGGAKPGGAPRPGGPDRGPKGGPKPRGPHADRRR